MESRPRITRVVLENYKSIAFCDVKLGPLAILVGANGAGKSNFLDALRFLSEAIKGPIETALQNRGGFDQVLRRGVSKGGHLGIRIEFETGDRTTGYYSIRMEKVTPGEHRLEREKCFLATGEYYEFDKDTPVPMTSPSGVLAVLKGNRTRLTPPLDTKRLALFLPLMAAYPEFSGVFGLISNSHFYGFRARDFQRPAASDDANRVLLPDGVNLANVWNVVFRHYERIRDRILQYLQVVNPTLQSVEPVEFGGYRSIDFVFDWSLESFSPAQVSDGTLQSLAVLTALLQPSLGVEGVSLVGVEEPEAAVYPAAAGVLFDAMREASASVQVIATTHSADLLDKEEIDSDAILSVELEGGETRIGHVDQTGRKVLKERLYTAGQLMRMNYLRPEALRPPNESDMESVLFGDPVPA